MIKIDTYWLSDSTHPPEAEVWSDTILKQNEQMNK